MCQPFPSADSDFSSLTLLLGSKKGIRSVKTQGWGAGMVICLERGADLHMAQLMPQPLTVSCFSKIQIGFTFLVPAQPGSPRKRAVKWVCAVQTVCGEWRASCGRAANDRRSPCTSARRASAVAQ